jgi:hypothetical protein
MKYRFFCLACSLLLSACSSPQVPLAAIPARQIETQKITLGAAQKIMKGASSAEVVSLLSSPNIVTANKDGSETWVYDKISNETETVIGNNAGVLVSSSRTLIVVIKFDLDRKVETVQYRQTSY